MAGDWARDYRCISKGNGWARLFLSSAYRFTKRLLDIFFSFCLLILLLPVFLVIAFALKLEGRGPLFFLQERAGQGGRPFRMFKFRSMRTDAEQVRAAISEKTPSGPVFKLRDDPRVTCVGRILRRMSLDELPQFLNVLLGDMSLVGPRPLPIRDIESWQSSDGIPREKVEEWLLLRQAVRPGVTGLWQISGRSLLPLYDWIRYDLEYIEKRSLLFDLKIFALTPIVVLLGKGAI